MTLQHCWCRFTRPAQVNSVRAARWYPGNSEFRGLLTCQLTFRVFAVLAEQENFVVLQLRWSKPGDNSAYAKDPSQQTLPSLLHLILASFWFQNNLRQSPED